MPEKFRKNKVKPRGVSNRNRGLKWIRANATDGVFYFADDDNTYDVSLFEQVGLDDVFNLYGCTIWPANFIPLGFLPIDSLHEEGVHVASGTDYKVRRQ